MVTILLAKQILVLFLMMGCGFALVKAGLLRAAESRTLSVVTIYLILPCVILNAFQIEDTPEIRSGFLLAVAAAVAIHMLLFALCAVCRGLHLAPVEKASLIYSNAGNLIIPLVTAVLGGEWVIYASAFLCVQMVMLWTHGQSLMQGRTVVNWRKLLSNGNLLAIAVGLVLFFLQIRLPSVIDSTLSSFSAAIGPVSMVMIGMLLADVDWRKVLSGRRVYGILMLKMIVFPGVVLVFLRMLGQMVPVANSRTILLISLLAVITPSATTITQMAQLYGQDAEYAGAINVLTTVVCILTMPLMVFLYLL